MKRMKMISAFMFLTICALIVTILVLGFNNNTTSLNVMSANLKAQISPLADTTAVVDNTDGYKALAAGIGIGLAALGGTIGMGLAVAKASESISRQPEADGKIRSAFMLGLVFIETVVIYALIVGILVIFVL